MMTEQELRTRVDQLKDNHDDDEVAHSEEDRIYKDVLRAIASGEAVPDAATLATIALECDDLDFYRWCA